MGNQRQASQKKITRDLERTGTRPDVLVLRLLAVALALGTLPGLVVGLALSGTTPAALPWVTPVSSSFLGAAVFSASFLSFGRFSVLRDAASFWIGIALASFGIANAYYVLTWPGLLPNGQALVSDLANTPAWISVLGPGLFGVLLIVAAVARWPGENALSGNRWLWFAIFGLVLNILASSLLVSSEHSLPVLINPDGSFTLLLIILNTALILLLGIGAVFTFRYYLKTGDVLSACIAFVQVAFAVGTGATFLGARRYDATWYAARFSMLGPYFAVLFGLVWDYIGLLRREREAHLAAEEARAAAAVQVRDHFIAVASHELKTPLTTIKGYAELVVQRAAQLEADESLLRMLKTINAQSVRLEKMIHGLLDISRIERGQLSLECAPLDLQALLEPIIEDMRPTLRKHTLTIQIVGGPFGVNGDAARLEQVFQNLIHNAIKYSPMGGSVSIQLRRMDGAVQVIVADTGIGIPEQDLAQLFTRFHRARNAEAFHIIGLGIGLYVVREIVRLHHGEIAVESQESVGSRFTVTLPLALDI